LRLSLTFIEYVIVWSPNANIGSVISADIVIAATADYAIISVFRFDNVNARSTQDQLICGGPITDSTGAYNNGSQIKR
jgi:hypothetical protein